MRIAVIFALFVFLASTILTGKTVARDAGRDAASVAAFTTVERVTESARCQNCHTVTTFPRQGDDFHRHQFNVVRGADGHGAPGMNCATCHGVANNTSSGVPGAPDWHLAPLSMGWEGLSPKQRCGELTDPKRNGHRNGAAIIDHLNSGLVRWAWAPGTDARGHARKPPSVDYATFMAAAKTWVAGSARCKFD